MGWEDRDYYRDRGGMAGSALQKLFFGSVPLFTAFGIRVRAHAMLLWFIGCTILLDWERGYPLELRFFTMTLLTVAVILHEFGHCFAARWVGGSADDILLWPLGGLAYAEPPRRPLPTFLTVAAGPAVNMLLCAICAPAVWLLTAAPHVMVSFNPLHPLPHEPLGFSQPAFYFYWFFVINYFLFLFNVVLPIFPLDGGRMWQAILWPQLGYRRSMSFACMSGMIGSVLLGIVGFYLTGDLFLPMLAIWTFYECYQQRAILQETRVEEWQDPAVDYSASLFMREESPRRKRISARVVQRARRLARAEAAERQKIDNILAKVSSQGMASLSWLERRTLKKATARQRRREMELSRYQ